MAFWRGCVGLFRLRTAFGPHPRRPGRPGLPSHRCVAALGGLVTPATESERGRQSERMRAFIPPGPRLRLRSRIWGCAFMHARVGMRGRTCGSTRACFQAILLPLFRARGEVAACVSSVWRRSGCPAATSAHRPAPATVAFASIAQVRADSGAWRRSPSAFPQFWRTRSSPICRRQMRPHVAAASAINLPKEAASATPSDTHLEMSDADRTG